MAARLDEMERRLDERWTDRNRSDDARAAETISRIDALTARHDGDVRALTSRVESIEKVVAMSVIGPKEWSMQRRTLFFAVFTLFLSTIGTVVLLYHLFTGG